MEAAELIASIAAAPEDRARWAVYADWLLEHDDPRGELIAMSLAAEQRSEAAVARRVEALSIDEDRLLSPGLAAHAHLWLFTFWRGFIRAARWLGTDDARGDAVHALFADPHACLLDRLAIHQLAPCRALLAAERPTIRRLELGMPALSGELRHLPNLEWLELVGAERAETLTSSRLRHLEGPLGAALVRRLARDLPALETLIAAQLEPVDALAHPRLRRLRCRIGAALDGDAFTLPRLERLDAMLELEPLDPAHPLFARPPGSLAALTLIVDAAQDPVSALAATPLASQLRELKILRLDDADSDDELLDALIARREHFPELARVLLGSYPYVPELDEDEYPVRPIPAMPNVKVHMRVGDDTKE